ncbi:hypothetical protein [Sulfobacillus thermosulfidooxidans]|uniref:hypothetical protein n=1 Tax=Sulfobacillus thermosulfidooxidans TaxID=28034 RepID=UPI0011129516|nr:hypothetical protein [Sulfobacillus thermosulfidooxidans]
MVYQEHDKIPTRVDHKLDACLFLGDGQEGIKRDMSQVHAPADFLDELDSGQSPSGAELFQHQPRVL